LLLRRGSRGKIPLMVGWVMLLIVWKGEEERKGKRKE
jgi:hypothetical protein